MYYNDYIYYRQYYNNNSSLYSFLKYRQVFLLLYMVIIFLMSYIFSNTLCIYTLSGTYGINYETSSYFNLLHTLHSHFTSVYGYNYILSNFNHFIDCYDSYLFHFFTSNESSQVSNYFLYYDTAIWFDECTLCKGQAIFSMGLSSNIFSYHKLGIYVGNMFSDTGCFMNNSYSNGVGIFSPCYYGIPFECSNYNNIGELYSKSVIFLQSNFYTLGFVDNNLVNNLYWKYNYIYSVVDHASIYPQSHGNIKPIERVYYLSGMLHFYNSFGVSKASINLNVDEFSYMSTCLSDYKYFYFYGLFNLINTQHSSLYSLVFSLTSELSSQYTNNQDILYSMLYNFSKISKSLFEYENSYLLSSISTNYLYDVYDTSKYTCYFRLNRFDEIKFFYDNLQSFSLYSSKHYNYLMQNFNILNELSYYNFFSYLYKTLFFISDECYNKSNVFNFYRFIKSHMNIDMYLWVGSTFSYSRDRNKILFEGLNFSNYIEYFYGIFYDSFYLHWVRGGVMLNNYNLVSYLMKSLNCFMLYNPNKILKYDSFLLNHIFDKCLCLKTFNHIIYNNFYFFSPLSISKFSSYIFNSNPWDGLFSGLGNLQNGFLYVIGISSDIKNVMLFDKSFCVSYYNSDWVIKFFESLLNDIYLKAYTCANINYDLYYYTTNSSNDKSTHRISNVCLDYPDKYIKFVSAIKLIFIYELDIGSYYLYKEPILLKNCIKNYYDVFKISSLGTYPIRTINYGFSIHNLWSYSSTSASTYSHGVDKYSFMLGDLNVSNIVISNIYIYLKCIYYIYPLFFLFLCIIVFSHVIYAYEFLLNDYVECIQFRVFIANLFFFILYIYMFFCLFDIFVSDIFFKDIMNINISNPSTFQSYNVNYSYNIDEVFCYLIANYWYRFIYDCSNIYYIFLGNNICIDMYAFYDFIVLFFCIIYILGVLYILYLLKILWTPILN